MNRTNLLLVIIFLSAAFFCAATGVASAITLSDKYVGNTVVDLEWTEYWSTDFSKYELCRDEGLIHTEFNRSNTFYRDEGLSKGNKYNYVIKVYNASGGLVATSTKMTVTAGEVHGTITRDTTWTAATSPYDLTSDVTVEEGATLTIQPGVTVNTGLYMIGIKGTITPLDTVTFNGRGFVLSDFDGFSIKNCVFDGATGVSIGIALYRCNLSFIDSTVVKNYASHGIYLSGDNNTLTNITASYNGDFGIRLSGGNNTLTNNIASNNGDFGIDLSGDNNTLTNNIAASNRFGGICLEGDNNMLTDNTVSNNRRGIGLKGDNNTLINNTVSNSTFDGIYLSGDNNALTNNTASNNSNAGIYLSGDHNTLTNITASYNGDFGIRLSGGNNTLTNNIASNSGDFGIDLSGDNNALTNNIASNNGYKGICLSGGNNTLTNNIASNNSNAGIRLSGGNNTLTSNIASNNGWEGIYLSGDNNALTNNTASNNSNAGIRLSVGHNTLTNNIASNNGHEGICLSGGHNTLTNNIASNNGHEGICLSGGNNTLTNNIASNNGDFGICLSGGHNTLTNNIASNNSNSGIYWYFDSGDNNTLTNNTASNNGNYGIHLSGLWSVSADNNTLTGNTASNNGNNGIHLSGDNNTLTGNTASNNGNNGIYLYDSSNNNTLTSNTANSNNGHYGIYLSGDNNALTDNIVNLNNKYGIRLYSPSNNNTLRGNDVSNNEYGICLYASSNCLLTDNIASNTTGSGIILGWSSNNTLKGNIANSNDGSGIMLTYSNSNNLSHNIAASNRFGGICLEGDNNMLTDNTVSNNRRGIGLKGDNNTLINNTVSNSTVDGIYLDYSSNNNLRGNTVTGNNGCGVDLEDSSNNNLRGNTVTGNNRYGIKLELDGASNNNTIYNNYFNNTHNAYDDGNNIWNITKTPGKNIVGGPYLGGNYWSDYAGADIEGDGLGDTSLPYNCSEQIAHGGDYRPLTVSLAFRASTHYHLPHTYVLLYTELENVTGYEQCSCSNIYAYVVVNDKINYALPMKNDGAGLGSRNHPDFIADDCHFSRWLLPESIEEAEKYVLDLYVTEKSFFDKESAHKVDTIELERKSDPKLLVLTDFRELFKEFDRTARGSSSADENQNCIRDYYEAVDRLQEYATAHNGTVVDVRKDAYTRDHSYYSGYVCREPMWKDIDTMISKLPDTMKNTIKFIAIIGDDAVVPFYRVDVLPGCTEENNYVHNEIGTGPKGQKTYKGNNPTLLDIANRRDSPKGHWMSDIPYGTFRDGPCLDVGLGRIFRDKPLELVQLIDAFEQPLDLRTGQSRTFIVNARNELEDDKVQFHETAEDTIVPPVKRHYSSINRSERLPRFFVGNYATGAHWVTGEDLSLSPRKRFRTWKEEDINTKIKGQADLLVLLTHGHHWTFKASDNQRGILGQNLGNTSITYNSIRLFGMNVTLEKDLDSWYSSNNLSERLKNEFEKNEYPLSRAARINKADPGKSEWTITDQDITYPVEKFSGGEFPAAIDVSWSPKTTPSTYHLLITGTCHAGLNIARFDGHRYNDMICRQALSVNSAFFGTTSYDTGYDHPFCDYDYYHDRMRRFFLERLFSPKNHTLGDVLQQAHGDYYSSLWRVNDNDRKVLYTVELYGLPTQSVITRGAAKTQGSGLKSLPTQSRKKMSDGFKQLTAVNLSFNSTVNISHFEVVEDEQGRVLFAIPHNGRLGGVEFAPILPMVHHSYLLPYDAANVSVVLTSNQSHFYEQTVEMVPFIPVSKSFGPLNGTANITNPYPESVLNYSTSPDIGGLRLDVLLVPLQYNPDTGQVTLYDRLDYKVSYTATTNVTVNKIEVNDGNHVNIDLTDVPINVTISAAESLNGALLWEIRDAAGNLVDIDYGTIDIEEGISQVSLSVDSLDWEPGPKQFMVQLYDAHSEDETGRVVASGQKCFTAIGTSLEVSTNDSIYGSSNTSATVIAVVRNETGAKVSGLASSFTQKLGGNETTLVWSGDADGYTTSLELTDIASGQHNLSVFVNGCAAETLFLVDRNPPTSTACSPAEVYTSAFKVRISGDDNVSAVDEYYVQYRVGENGTWTDWLMRIGGFDYSHTDQDNLEPIFGPTEPINVTEGTTYCFRVNAVDYAGNLEEIHTEADTCTTYVAEAKVVINEVYPNPVADGGEWIEFYNDGEVDLNLTGWRIVNGDDELDYSIPANSSDWDGILESDSYLVLHLGGTLDTPAEDLCAGIAYGVLGNEDDSVSLLSDDNIGVDFVRYGNLTDDPPTGTSWTGVNPDAPVQGQSLGRDKESTDTDDGSDWENTGGVDADGPTPGEQNLRAPQ